LTIDIVYENGWAAANKGAGDNDNWGVKDLNTCCGKVDVKIPTALAPGDYLLRAEVIALHTAGSSGGAQFYMSCCKCINRIVKLLLTMHRPVNRQWNGHAYPVNCKLSWRL
jgi:hypothetical protein